VDVRITEEPGYPGPSSFRLFKRGGFKVGRVERWEDTATTAESIRGCGKRITRFD